MEGKDFGEFGECETPRPATDARTVSKERFDRLTQKFDAREKELYVLYHDLSSRVRELEHDRDALVERQIDRRLRRSHENGSAVNECQLKDRY